MFALYRVIGIYLMLRVSEFLVGFQASSHESEKPFLLKSFYTQSYPCQTPSINLSDHVALNIRGGYVGGGSMVFS